VPYFITDSATGCAGWATIKDDGEVIGCHTTKQAAIDQMVAVSIAEGMEPGGERAVTVPQYVRRAAARGLELRREGYGGDGLTEGTIREARLMARGQMSDDKVVRANAWAARHAPDLDAPQNRNPEHPQWPGAGAVAHYLWGIDPLDPAPARAWLQRQADSIKDERHNMTKVEIREMQVQDLEVREAGNGAVFSGYAAVFNSDSEPLPFVEQIRPGAFQRTLGARNNVKMFVNHDDTMVLASTRSGTLRLSEDGRGLRAEADLPDTTYARDLAVLLRSKVVDSMSFGFSVPRGGDEWSQDGQRRFLNEIRLHEVSVVTGFPAYEATSATIRKAQILAQRTQTDADALADALTALESGNELNDDQAALLVDVVERQRVKADEPQQDNAELINVLRDKLELLAKAI
jgi:HK97 family phage prohead protease